jgi:hypothetical protein
VVPALADALAGKGGIGVYKCNAPRSIKGHCICRHMRFYSLTNRPVKCAYAERTSQL